MNHSQRLALAKRALWGTSIGDAFGESFFGDRNEMIHHIEQRTMPQTSWEFTDDTVMAIAVFEQLEKHQTIIQDDLALQFSLNHDKDVNRGYGATARRILREIGEGADWKVLSQSVFDEAHGFISEVYDWWFNGEGPKDNVRMFDPSKRRVKKDDESEREG